MLGRLIVLATSLMFLVAHLTGEMKALLGFFDFGAEPSRLIYVAVLPFVGIMGFILLRDDR